MNYPITWLAGILEGEGSFVLRKPRQVGVQVQMADRDVVDRVSKIFGKKTNGPYRDGRRPDGKDLYTAAVWGDAAVAVMKAIEPFMGERRKARFQVLYAANKLPRRVGGKPHRMADCHPDRDHYGRGLCATCWARAYRTENGRKKPDQKAGKKLF